MSDFSFTKDFKRIDWGPTLLIGFERSLAAGLVWFVVSLFVPAIPVLSELSSGDSWVYLFFPITYFLVILPAGLILSLLGRLPGIVRLSFGLMVPFCALFVAVGDPFVFIVHKIKPTIVPVENYGFLNFNYMIFVLKPEE